MKPEMLYLNPRTRGRSTRGAGNIDPRVLVMVTLMTVGVPLVMTGVMAIHILSQI